jgi:hypothetical protein
MTRLLYPLSYLSRCERRRAFLGIRTGSAGRTGRAFRTRTAAKRRFIDRALTPLSQRQFVWRQAAESVNSF